MTLYNQFPSHTNGHPISIGGIPSPVVSCLEKAIQQIPSNTKMQSVELHWPHSDTAFRPLIVVNCDNGDTYKETFSIFEASTDFSEWTAKIMFELLGRNGSANTIQIHYDPAQVMVIFTIINVN